MDKRTRRTRRAIFDAFEQLLAEKSYSSISASEIIARADVGRTTFYAHFETKDALLTELCRDLFAHVVAPPAAAEADHAFGAASSMDERLTHVLYHLKDQHARLKSLFESPSSHLFWDAFETELASFVAIGAPGSMRFDGVPDDLRLRVLTATFTEVCRWWFAHDLADAPETVIGYYRRLAS